MGKKKAGLVKLQALNVIRHDKKEIQPGEKFEIDKETADWLERINSAVKLKEEVAEENVDNEEDGEEEGQEGAE